jgi:hypothetical protein
MVKRILIILIVLSFIGVLGCSATSKTTTTSTAASVRPIREAKIGKAWMMKQLEIDLNKEIPLTLILKDGDRVDGYFYLEKGDNIGFNISGNSVLYISKPPDTETARITSDRFSFIASQTQGIAYILNFKTSNLDDGQQAATVFLEIVYPATASLSIPVGTK